MISVTTSARSNSKWDMSVGINSSVRKGMGNASGTVNVGYKPQKGTQISSSVDLADPMIFTLSTSRALESRTVVMTSVRTMPRSKKLALSVVSHRDLWDNMFRGSWALGIGSDLSMQYGLLSLTSLSDEYPTCSVKLNLGVNQYPIKIVTKQDFGVGRTGLLSFAWQPRGVEWKAILSRSLTSYSNVSMGIQHQTSTGLTWLLQAERGNFTFRLPISICCVTNPTYRMSYIWFSLLTLILDDVLGDLIHDTTQDRLKPATDHDSTFDDAAETSIVKAKSDAEQQLVLMRPTAERNMEREQQCNGLYIYQAQYFVDHGGPSVDVATQLQFWVRNSTLCLPAGSKSSLLGFYPLLPPLPPPQRRRFSWLRSWLWSSEVSNDAQPVPQLRIRYTFGEETYEITINDTDELVLPSPRATALGSKDRVR
ncbi:hypothetical protein MHU86_22926 [Fragilaria crotonensis]|nr:hypothetical protein MHU86_22926 [Fragilaria crotonensis]